MQAPRIEYGLDSDAYRAAEGLSHSESKTLRRSPFHFKRLSEPRPPELVKAPSPQMFVGTLAHCALLEPLEFDKRYVVLPPLNKNSTAYKELAAACIASGGEPITQLQRDIAFAQAASVRELPEVAGLLDGCACEVSAWWQCPRTGVLCKARPDLVKRFPPGALPEYPQGFAVLADLKTTEDASEEAFRRSVAEFSYFTQADHYSEGYALAAGVPVAAFMFVVVEREFPYACAAYTLDEQAMAVARDINDAARSTFARCTALGQWPGYPRESREISLPSWYLKRYLEGALV